MLPVFAVEPLPAPGPYELAGSEGHHAATVRRLAAGEQLELVDGVGGRALAQVQAAGRQRLALSVLRVSREPAPAPRLVVVQALAKADRGEQAVAMLTEVGADEIVPWSAAHCVVRWDGERGRKALGRWRSTAAAAAKQARRSWWPQVSELASTEQVARRLARADLALVLHEGADRPLAAALASVPAGEVVVVVGPEGGISDRELAALGTAPVRLGREVLRTATAGVAASAAVLAASRWR